MGLACYSGLRDVFCHPSNQAANWYGKEEKKQANSKNSNVQLSWNNPRKNVKRIHMSYCVYVYALELTHCHQNQEFQIFSGDQTDRIIFID